MQRFLPSTPRLALLAMALLAGPALHAAGDLTIYDDSLNGDWQNWSWAQTNTANTDPVHSGADSISVATNGGWQALYLQQGNGDTTNTAPYGKLVFWVNGGPVGGQQINVTALLNQSANNQPSVSVGPIAANTWTQVQIPLSSLGADNSTTFNGLWFQLVGNDPSPTLYIDDISLTTAVPVIPPPVVNGMSLYDDGFANGWQNWSWATVDPNQSTVVHTGAAAIAATEKATQAIYFEHDPFSTQGYANLTFWINGGPVGGQSVKLVGLLGSVQQPAYTLPALVANTWTKVVVPLSALGLDNKSNLNGLWFQEAAGVDQPTFYLDDVFLELAPPPSTINVSVNGKGDVRKVDPRIFGVNTADWDGLLGQSMTGELLNEIDNQALRFPGGSASDAYHWFNNVGSTTTDGSTNFDAFAQIAVATGAQVYITTNYGSGTPDEAANWVKYANKTKGYNFKYWEIGNENYGTWETDNNTRPWDPVTYAARFKQYYTQMKAIDPTIKIGAVVVDTEDGDANYTDESITNPRTGVKHSGWTPLLFANLKLQGVLPDFVIFHRYEQAPFGESDAYLLNAARGWPTNSTGIRQMLTDYLGADGAKVEVDCTENNSVYSNPGKQTTSLVNGLYVADSVGNILKTEFNSLIWWDLRNGKEASNNNAASLYGWRKYGDYGIVDSANPAGPADRYPTFYAYKLLSHYARNGETVLQAGADFDGLGVYAVRSVDNKEVHVLLINKRKVESLNANITLSGFTPSGTADVYSYGIPQDTAAQTGTGSADVAQSTTTIAGKNFTFSPGPYSAVILNIKGTADASGTLSLTRSGFTLNRRTNTMVQTVTIKNTGSAAVNGPINLVLDGLSLNTSLTNANGTTANVIPTGSPYLTVSNTSLAAGASTVATLQFAVPASGGITYTPRTLTDGTNP
jgi:hypothetical protein